jgi:CRP/FNR family transcriptional regulator, anaerobic regulatory protein
MNTDPLFQALSAIHPVSPDFKASLLKELSCLELPKNFNLLEAPKISDHVYFLNRGSAMSYTFVDGRKHVEWLWKKDQLIVAPRSFFEQMPSREFIQLTEPSEVLCVSHAGVKRLLASFHEANFVYRIIMNQYYELGRKRIRDLQQMDGEARFKKLLQAFRHIEQILPQEYIASYLGITPQSLSRIKRGMDRH